MQGSEEQDTSLHSNTFDQPIQSQAEQYEAETWLNSTNQWPSTTSIPPLTAGVSSDAALLLVNEPTISPGPSWDCPDLDGMAWTDNIEGSLPSPFSVVEQLNSRQNSLREAILGTQSLSPASEVLSLTLTPPQQRQEDLVQDIPHQVLHIPTALSEYFFSEVIPLYCVWDSKLNTMRSIVEAMWQSSGALHHTIQSMAAACLSESFPHLLLVARQEHGRALGFIKNKVATLQQKQAMALAATFLGHTSSWISPNNLAPDMFKTTYNMLEEMATEDGSSTNSFFHSTMDYWAMLLAYLTDIQQVDTSGACSSPFTTNTRIIEPHPYCGISHRVIKILRDTGTLIFSYRKQTSKISFMTEQHVDIFRNALRQARRLERILLAHRLPESDQIKDPCDPQTPLKHLELMDEAYRCTGLLQLYRVFPDLLNERYAPWDKEKILHPTLETKDPTAEERQSWLTELALHVINVLGNIPFESRTRSAQPFIMVAVSSELVFSAQQASIHGSFETLDELPLRVTKARKFLSSRLAAYTHILPLQKTRAISQLINHIWEALDAGRQDVYWLDVAYEKKLGTMFG